MLPMMSSRTRRSEQHTTEPSPSSAKQENNSGELRKSGKDSKHRNDGGGKSKNGGDRKQKHETQRSVADAKRRQKTFILYEMNSHGRTVR
jgi:hypothetical protein